MQDLEPKRTSTVLNTRDELLISLLASEAVVESRDFEIFSAEEVEELKKEEQILVSRLGAQEKKLSMEMKIRDAAVTLSKVNASHRKMSKQTEEQLEAANKRVDAAQKEFWRLSERANDTQKKLLQHRAGVLSFSVRRIEKQSARPDSGHDSGYTTPNHSVGAFSPTSTTSSILSSSRFDGAHFFAGHAESIVPKRRKTPSMTAADIASLEDKLKAATDSLNAASKKQAEMSRELSLLQLEKEEVETVMGMDLQSAEETIDALEKELPRFEQLEDDLHGLQREKEEWLIEKRDLESRIQDSHAQGDAQAQNLLQQTRSDLHTQLQQRDEEIRELRSQMAAAESQWATERRELEDEKLDDMARLQEEMDLVRAEDGITARELRADLEKAEVQLKELLRSRGHIPSNSSIVGLVSDVAAQIQALESRSSAQSQAQEEWDVLRRKLEDDVRSGLDRRESLARELETARQDREDSRRALRQMEDSIKDDSSRVMSMTSVTSSSSRVLSPIDTSDATKIIAALQPLWSILPSAEARASRADKNRNFRAGSPTSPISPKAPASSLSELDVRSLKILYDDARSLVHGPNVAPFSLDKFISRVKALLADDKALVERLIRFAQAHDMLKKNAERAQKLAQESNVALETYQKQVRTLEERNLAVASQQAEFQNELQELEATVERVEAEKLELETLAAEQAETCAQLTDANNTLSARALALAEEAASAPEMVKRQFDAQLSETKAALKAAQEDIDAMRNAEQSQSMALLDELNSMQTENGNLKAQLRSLKK